MLLLLRGVVLFGGTVPASGALPARWSLLRDDAKPVQLHALLFQLLAEHALHSPAGAILLLHTLALLRRTLRVKYHCDLWHDHGAVAYLWSTCALRHHWPGFRLREG